MFGFKNTTATNSRKDAKSFAPSCSCASKNSEIDILAGIALAVSVFLCIIRIDICIILALSALIIKASALKRKKHFVVEL